MILLGWILACSTPDPASGTLLLLSERDGAPATWVLDLDGPSRRIDGIPGAVYPAAADPQGTHALLVSAEDYQDRTHRERLWITPLDGGEPVALTPGAGKIRNPAWTADGAWIVFESDAMSYRDLFRVRRDGSGLERLTAAEHGSFEPDVGPARIAFGTSRDGDAEIYTMAVDGSDVRRLTEHAGDDTRPRWAPDGETLAWLRRDQGQVQVWTSDGRSEPRPLRVANPEHSDLDLAWSPEGDRVAVSVQSAPRDVVIQIVEVATGRIEATFAGEGPDEHPAWSPDGQWIAFSSSRDGGPALYLADTEAWGVRRLTDPGGVDWLPRWVR